MFQDTLLIIKSDYMHRRKALLIYLLKRGFQIQGRRRIQFSPELAAEFYQDMADEPCFMLQVILLSKGPSEVFILAKENAIDDLLDSLVCYFGNSVDMDQNVHVTRCIGRVRREICFIFPNYIFEPIYCVEQMKFCSNNPLVSSLISEVYDIVTTPERDPQKGWKEKLAEWLTLSNKNLPHMCNQCSPYAALNVREIGQQTEVTVFKHGQTIPAKGSESSGMVFDTDGSSLNITSSSCVTCSAFDSGPECVQQHQTMVDIIKDRTVPLIVSESSSKSMDQIKNVEENDDQCVWMTEETEATSISADAEIVTQDNGAVEALEPSISDDIQSMVVIRSKGADSAGDASTDIVVEKKSVSGEFYDKTDQQPQVESLENEVSSKSEMDQGLSKQPIINAEVE